MKVRTDASTPTTRQETTVRFRRRIAAAAVIAGASLVPLAPGASAAPGDIYGVDIINQLIRFSPGSPGTVTGPIPISGLLPGENILGIDFRPSNGLLYGVTSGNNNTTTGNRIVTIDQNNGVATQVSILNDGASPVPAPVVLDPSSGEFAVDFNPVPDRLRIISEGSNQNLRVNVDTGATIVDGNVAYAPGDPNASKNTPPETVNVTGAAYTFPDNDPATGTTLYDIDSGGTRTNPSNILSVQNPPNSGTLNTVGNLGVNSNDLVGFDIGTGVNGPAYAAFDVGFGNELYTINLTSGAANNIGVIGYNPALVDIAIELAVPPPPPVIPEVPLSALLPAAGLGLLGTVFVIRRKTTTAPTPAVA